MKRYLSLLIFSIIILSMYLVFSSKPVSAASSTCGNGVVDSGEQCELPGSVNNFYCLQSTGVCSGRLFGVRDSYGDCNASCGCVFDSFSFSCSVGHCGAECARDSDCDDGNSFTVDRCDLSNCSCVHSAVGCSGSNSSLLSRFVPSSCVNASGSFSSYCSGNSVVLFGCNFGSGKCVSVSYDCSSYNMTCAGGYCSACLPGYEWVDASDHRKGCKPVSSCGNGVVDSGEQCELPGSVNNFYCLQSTGVCSGRLFGVRDSYGDCNASCGCVFDSFSFSCSVGH
ncbi:MAG: hypothetical protein QXJ50_02210, partial [Candidatus Woesearchaeota archaeon]